MIQKTIRKSFTAICCILAMAVLCSVAAAQGTTGIHGIVKDPSGALIPKVTVKLTDMETNIVRTSTSNSDGAFVFVDLPAGTFKLASTAQGFEASVIDAIAVDSGHITDVVVSMQVGSATETVQVTATGVQLETTSNEIGTTIDTKSVNTLPFTSRDGLYFALLMPGAQGLSSSSEYSTFNGLPNASMNITLDGMNNNSQRFKSGGTSLYAFAPERLDAIEEATVSTSGMGADASGQGAMQIRFVTKRGTDKFHFHVSEQFYNEDLNANTFFNDARGIPKSVNRTADYAGNVGGPLLPWIHPLKGKFFFFLNFEDVPSPSSAIISNTVLAPSTYSGNFTYLGTDGQNHTANLLSIAGAAGFPSTLNTVTSSMLNQIQASYNSPKTIGFIPVVGTPYEQTMQWNSGLNLYNLYPTARLDYHITPKLNYYISWNMRNEVYTGIPEYPGGPIPDNYPNAESYKINTYVLSQSMNYAISPNMFNNTTFGIQSNNEYFFNPANPYQWAPYANIDVTLPIVTPYLNSNLPQTRNNPVIQLSDTFTWIKGKHTFTAGAAYLNTWFFQLTYAGEGGIPAESLGIATNDAFNNVISTATLPFLNTSNSDLANAKAIYAMLTGRVSSYSVAESVNENTHQYAPYTPGVDRIDHKNLGVFFADSWRILPNLTLNYGLRWEFDGPIHNTNGMDTSPNTIYGPSVAPFQPGVLGGVMNPAFTLTSAMYKHDYTTPEPNIGLSWSPQSENPFLDKFLGHNKTVVSLAYRISYYDEGLNAAANVMEGNTAGNSQSASGAAALAANPGAYFVGGAAPATTLSTTCFCFPIPLSNYVLNGGITSQVINPNIKTPYVQDWNVRYQREIARGTILSVQYVGNKATHIWHYQNINETNTQENGFINEFKNAQNNLAIANGISVGQLTAQPYVALKTANFANTGLPGQVALPIMQTAFGANGSNAALASSSGFGSSTFITDLQQGLVGTLASSLASTSANTYYCRLVGANFAPCASQGFTAATPYPINFFRANPYSNTVDYQNDDANSNYNGLQIDLRHSFAHGLTMDGNFVWSHVLGTVMNSTDQTATTTWQTIRNGHLNYGPTPFDQRYRMNIYGTYDLPVGKGRALNIDNPILDRVLGGWTLGTINTIASGTPSTYTGGHATFNTTADGGVVYGNGMTLKQILALTGTQEGNFNASCTCIKTDVSGITLSNGTVNPAYVVAGQTPGVIGPLTYYYGKTQFNFAASVQKQIRINERVRMLLFAEASNLLNHPFFAQGSTSLTSSSFGNITSASGNRTMFLRWTLNF